MALIATTWSDFYQKLQDEYRDATTGNLSEARAKRITNSFLNELWADYNIKSAERKVEFDYLDTIHEYNLNSIASDYFEKIDIKREEEYQTDPFEYKKPEEFAVLVGKGWTNPIFTIHNEDNKNILGIKYAGRYSASTVHSCDSLTSNGTWQVAGDASNLTVDTVEYKEGSSSFNFDVTYSSGQARIYTTDISALDWSDYVNLNNHLLRFFIPSGLLSYVTSFELRWGSDTSNYYSVTVTTDAFGGSFSSNWNRLAFDWSNATTTGSPDDENIDYIDLRINFSSFSGTITDLRLDDIKTVQPERTNLVYQSGYHAKSSGGTWGQNLNDDYTIILLEDIWIDKMLLPGVMYRILRTEENARSDGYKTDYRIGLSEFAKSNPSRIKKSSRNFKIYR